MATQPSKNKGVTSAGYSSIKEQRCSKRSTTPIYIKPYYHPHPSMYKFQELMNKSNKRDYFRLMIFIKIVMKDYDSTM